jgi:hypothetical protein
LVLLENHLVSLYVLKDLQISELYGRSIIVHEEPDDLGKGPFEDSHTTGHSGKRIACAIIGRSHVQPSKAAAAEPSADNPKGRKPRVPGTGYGTRKKALHTIHNLKR